MTRNQINVALVSILEALAEDPGHAVPEGYLYMALQAHDASVYTLSAFYQIRGLLLRAGLVTAESGPCLRISQNGLAMVATIRTHRNDAKRAKGA